MPSSAFQRILRRYMTQRIALTREGIAQVRTMLRDTATTVASDIESLSARYGQSNVRVEQLRDLKGRIDQAIDDFTHLYRTNVNLTNDALGNSAMNRTGEIVKEVTGIPPEHSILLRAKLAAFDFLATRTRFKDGLLLSERIWRIGDTAKRDIGAILSKDVLAGYHPTQIARDLRGYVVGDARNNMRYVTERLARTEHTAAFAATSRSTFRAVNKDASIPVTFAMKFNVSPGHVFDELCDACLLGGNLAPDIYSVAQFPIIPLHPHCMCYDTPVPILNGKLLIR